jgi:hypothetical protein
MAAQRDLTHRFAILASLCRFSIIRWCLLKPTKRCFFESFSTNRQKTLDILLNALFCAKHPSWSMQILELFASVPSEYLEEYKPVAEYFKGYSEDTVLKNLLKLQSALTLCFSIQSLKLPESLVDWSDISFDPFREGQIMGMTDLDGEREALFSKWFETYNYSAKEAKADTSAFVGRVKMEAESGNLDSQYMLGLIYLDGYGGGKNIDKGIYWMRAAAARRHPIAQCTMGYLLCLGSAGVKEDKKEGVAWLEAAAHNRNRVAKAALKRYRTELGLT